ncbi:intraflagellar transport protein 22 homolog [Otolemur garnettii]|uniref:intraflagellar transport protein 22 homolog n=1 Tax=Otolemur garnettii TaxID=30611 RepID=UPI000C7E917B|nr:intraflagellar transport protein 22 homolog [Otolemur garnettii]
MKDTHGVGIIFNANLPLYQKKIEMCFSCFVQQQLWDTQGQLHITGGDKGRLSLSLPLNKLKLMHLNLEDDPEEIWVEFTKYLKIIINSMSESRDR